MRRALVAAACLFATAGPMRAGQGATPTAVDSLQFMQGKWVGEGTSELGSGSGYFTFERVLNGKAWLRRNRSEYPGAAGRTPAVHEDLMIVYVDDGGARAFYTDTENHTIAYRVAIGGDKPTVTFVSDPPPGQPTYRLTYVRLDAMHMTVALEMAQPGHPDDFKTVVQGRVRRVD